ncbi:hypothetical protein DSO57_1009769 [Entomophthora muscae]|uniref:Uncharacterized protein n=1 Tax=Entomophthora muscae TaxID=34485 RepID=A0ACC2S8R4_9FUNG|nr:hypothetical protein DSO57_1009769 [Entomophthora muscae]
MPKVPPSSTPEGYIAASTITSSQENLSANISHNTQGALNEPPLDISNSMEKSDGNAKQRALSPN